MKDSEDKAHRISNLKDMINNIKDEEEDTEVYDDIEEDSELIDYLNEDTTDYDTLGIDDEYIYHPGDDDGDAFNLEENNINEDYIIKTPKTDDDENSDYNDLEEMDLDFGGDISENFDNVINAKIAGKSILGIVSSILGVIFIIISIFIFQSRSERIIDNVVSGESNFLFIIFLVIGILLILYGIFKLFNINQPFENITTSIESIEKEKVPVNTQNIVEKKKTPKPLEKSNIPLDKESYKIGEFDIDDLKKSHKKVDETENKDDKKEETSEKNPITKEIEEIEYEKAKLEGESIDEIFAEIDDLDDFEDDSKK